MADLYSLMHREAGPLATFTTRAEAKAELAAVLDDEPTWVDDLWVEPFELVIRRLPVTDVAFARRLEMIPPDDQELSDGEVDRDHHRARDRWEPSRRGLDEWLGGGCIVRIPGLCDTPRQ